MGGCALGLGLHHCVPALGEVDRPNFPSLEPPAEGGHQSVGGLVSRESKAPAKPRLFPGLGRGTAARHRHPQTPTTSSALGLAARQSASRLEFQRFQTCWRIREAPCVRSSALCRAECTIDQSRECRRSTPRRNVTTGGRCHSHSFEGIRGFEDDV